MHNNVVPDARGWSRPLGDTLHYVPAVVVPALVGAASVAIFTRLLGVEGYGVYSVVGAIVTIATVACAEWIGQSVLRYVPERRGSPEERALVAGALGLALALCAAVAAMATGLHVVVSGRVWFDALVLPAAAVLIAEVAFSVLSAVLQARLRARTASFFAIAGAVLRFGMALGFMLLVARNVPWLLAGAALGRGLTAAAMVSVVARAGGARLAPRVDRGVLALFASYGIPMIGWTVASQLLGLSDRFVISAVQGPGPAGIYSATYSLVTLGFGLLGGPLLLAAHPLIVAAWKRDRGGIGAVVASYSRLYVVAAMPALVVIVLCRREIVELLLTGDFRAGSALIPVLALGSVVWGFGRYGNKGLELSERTRVMFALIAVTALVNIALNLVFVPVYGYRAAAVTTLVCNTLYPLMVHRASRRHVPWRIPWATILEAAAAAAIAGVAGWRVRALAGAAAPAVVIVAVAAAVLGAYAALVWVRMRVRKGPVSDRS